MKKVEIVFKLSILTTLYKLIWSYHAYAIIQGTDDEMKYIYHNAGSYL